MGVIEKIRKANREAGRSNPYTEFDKGNQAGTCTALSILSEALAALPPKPAPEPSQTRGLARVKQYLEFELSVYANSEQPSRFMDGVRCVLAQAIKVIDDEIARLRNNNKENDT